MSCFATSSIVLPDFWFLHALSKPYLIDVRVLVHTLKFDVATVPPTNRNRFDCTIFLWKSPAELRFRALHKKKERSPWRKVGFAGWRKKLYKQKLVSLKFQNGRRTVSALVNIYCEISIAIISSLCPTPTDNVHQSRVHNRLQTVSNVQVWIACRTGHPWQGR